MVRVAGGVCFIALIVSTIRGSRSRAEDHRAPRGSRTLVSWYGRRFWWVVFAEVALLIAGLQVMRLTGAPTQANVAWIAFVVGLHFVALAFVWRETSIGTLGTIVLLLGAAGLAPSATSAMAWVPLLSGVCSGFVLLAGSLGAVVEGVVTRA